MRATSLLPAVAYALGGGAARREDGRARILMFHGTPRRLAGRLERLLRYVKRHFRVVPLATLVSAPDLRRCVALTFDDGLRSNVQVAWPLLARLGLPATFFVCPGLVDEGRRLWTHEARARLRRQGLSTGEIEARVEAMKRGSPGVSAPHGAFVPSPEEREAYDLAGWDELRALDPALIEIGSHSLTHAILTTLDAAQMEHEVAASRALLEERLRRPVAAFAYPNGSVDAQVHACVARHYACAVTVHEGFVEPGGDPHLLRRLNAHWNPLRLALALHRERRDDYFFVTPSRASGSQVAI